MFCCQGSRDGKHYLALNKMTEIIDFFSFNIAHYIVSEITVVYVFHESSLKCLYQVNHKVSWFDENVYSFSSIKLEMNCFPEPFKQVNKISRLFIGIGSGRPIEQKSAAVSAHSCYNTYLYVCNKKVLTLKRTLKHSI